MANIDRVAGFLVSATCREGENYDLLRNMYDSLHGQRARELGHVANVIGGFYQTNLWYGDAERMWEPLSADRQREAMAFLAEHAFTTPTALIDPDILLRLESNGAADKVLRTQESVLRTLLSESRIKRMSEQAARDPESSYAPVEMMRDLSGAIWHPLREGGAVDLYSRNLQRAYVKALASAVEGEGASDLPGLARSGLELAEILIEDTMSRVDDAATIVHLGDLAARIESALDTSKKPAADRSVEATGAPRRRPGVHETSSAALPSRGLHECCWHCR